MELCQRPATMVLHSINVKVALSYGSGECNVTNVQEHVFKVQNSKILAYKKVCSNIFKKTTFSEPQRNNTPTSCTKADSMREAALRLYNYEQIAVSIINRTVHVKKLPLMCGYKYLCQYIIIYVPKFTQVPGEILKKMTQNFGALIMVVSTSLLNSKSVSFPSMFQYLISTYCT